MEWETIETAPKDGTWFLVLSIILNLATPRRGNYVTPELHIVKRSKSSPESPGFWMSIHGHSFADDRLKHSLWAPIDSLPIKKMTTAIETRREEEWQRLREAGYSDLPEKVDYDTPEPFGTGMAK